MLAILRVAPGGAAVLGVYTQTCLFLQLWGPYTYKAEFCTTACT